MLRKFDSRFSSYGECKTVVESVKKLWIGNFKYYYLLHNRLYNKDLIVKQLHNWILGIEILFLRRSFGFNVHYWNSIGIINKCCKINYRCADFLIGFPNTCNSIISDESESTQRGIEISDYFVSSDLYCDANSTNILWRLLIPVCTKRDMLH